MRRILLYLITSLEALTLDVNTALATIAAIGLRSAVVPLVTAKWPVCKVCLRYSARVEGTSP